MIKTKISMFFCKGLLVNMPLCVCQHTTMCKPSHPYVWANTPLCVRQHTTMYPS